MSFDFSFYYSCKGCTERTPGCHGSCEKYKADKAEYEKLKAEHDRMKSIQSGLDQHLSREYARHIKAKRKHWGNY